MTDFPPLFPAHSLIIAGLSEEISHTVCVFDPRAWHTDLLYEVSLSAKVHYTGGGKPGVQGLCSLLF